MKRKTQIYSIFGQIESVVATAMIEQYGLHRIEPNDIPPTAAYNGAGERALFAIVVPGDRVQELERRIRELRA